MAPESNTGDGIELGLAAGGSVKQEISNVGFWAPVSIRMRADGSLDKIAYSTAS